VSLATPENSVTAALAETEKGRRLSRKTFEAYDKPTPSPANGN
jgi:hypothetical protein